MDVDFSGQTRFTDADFNCSFRVEVDGRCERAGRIFW